MTRIVLIGSFDTKAEPLSALVAALAARGEAALTLDTGVFASEVAVTWPACAVAERGGADHAALAGRGRAEAVSAMADGAASILRDLVAKGEVGAVVAMGGSNAASVFARVAPEIPIGIPKILMATAVAGDTKPVIAGNDVVLLYPVVDVEGDNAILSEMIDRLAATAAALKAPGPLAATGDRPRVALSMYGVTTPCVKAVSEAVQAAGIDPLVFHANGTGGRSIERFAQQGLVDAIADLTLAELANEVVGGAFPAGPDRMTGAARAGRPQVIAPGAIDMIAFGPRPTVPERFAGHLMHVHNDLVTLVRTNPAECHAIGRTLGARLGRPLAETAILIPLGGTSMLDRPGEPFHDPDAVAAFRAGLAETADPALRIETHPENINDPDFAAKIAAHLVDMVARVPRSDAPDETQQARRGA